jgi:hypothetical protein
MAGESLVDEESRKRMDMLADEALSLDRIHRDDAFPRKVLPRKGLILDAGGARAKIESPP